MAETAGSVVLALADQVAHLPRRLTAGAIELLPEGGLRLDGGEATSEAVNERALRRLLSSLLGLTRGTAPGLSRVGVRPSRGNLAAFVHELEVALVPVNRAAGRRALARLHRETVRALAAGIPVPAVQWARSVAEAVQEATPVIVEPAAVAPAPPAESLPLPVVAGVEEVLLARAPGALTPPLPFGNAPIDSSADDSAAAPLDDVTDRVPMAVLEEEGEIPPQHTVALSLPVLPRAMGAVDERDAPATVTPHPGGNEITAPLPAPARPVPEAGPSAPAAVEGPPVAPAEEITVPMPARARRRATTAPAADGSAAAGERAEPPGLVDQRQGSFSPGAAGATSNQGPSPARVEAVALEVTELDGEGSVPEPAPSSGVGSGTGAGRVERLQDATGDACAGVEEGSQALVKAAAGAKTAVLDLSGVQRMDTAGAWLIDRARSELDEKGVKASFVDARPEVALL
ncbi:MAG TPA: STAS domain-containing protein, partial [Polyangiaceae bacterium]|nr:STAS domain-containing protein [Polyangiaceae bacterium]